MIWRDIVAIFLNLVGGSLEAIFLVLVVGSLVAVFLGSVAVFAVAWRKGAPGDNGTEGGELWN